MINWSDIKIKGIEYCDNCLCTEAETGNIAIFCDLCQGVIINNLIYRWFTKNAMAVKFLIWIKINWKKSIFSVQDVNFWLINTIKIKKHVKMIL